MKIGGVAERTMAPGLRPENLEMRFVGSNPTSSAIVEIPFNKWSVDRILAGRKTCTTRTSKIANVGDFFFVEGRRFVIKSVVKCQIREVVKERYYFEGAKTIEEFVGVWNSIHKKVKYEDDIFRKVWVHTFREG